MWNFLYPLQQSHYSQGFETNDFTFVFVEKAAPHQVVVVNIDDEALAWAHKKHQALMNKVSDCVLFDNWPGYEPAQTVSLPGWIKAAA